jgi:hypothetical protein
MKLPVRLACGLVLALGALSATSAAGDPAPVKVRVVKSNENPARHPFQEKKQIVLPDGQCCDNAFVDVPAGKRLVIEYASASGFANGSQTFMYEVGTVVNGASAHTTHYLPVAQQISDGNTVAIAGQQVRLYADDGGGRVMLRASRSGDGEATVWMTVSGHLVDVP